MATREIRSVRHAVREVIGRSALTNCGSPLLLPSNAIRDIRAIRGSNFRQQLSRGHCRSGPPLFACGFLGLWFATEDGDHVLDGDDEQLIVLFKVDGDGVLWVEKNLVVLP